MGELRTSFMSFFRNALLQLGIPALCTIAAPMAVMLVMRATIALDIKVMSGAFYALLALVIAARYRMKAINVDSGVSSVSLDRGFFTESSANKYDKRPYDRTKRLLDVIVATICLVAMLPLLMAIILVISTQGLPLLIRHKRIGQGGKIIPVLKFRTMVVDADKILQEHLKSDSEAWAEWQQHHRLKKDPRVTRLGRVLRKTSLDELPQLINVLRGEMSLVGPRPIAPAETVFYGEKIKQYVDVKPGITGLWQVSNHYHQSPDIVNYRERVRLDVEYVAKRSLGRDLMILITTIPAALSSRVDYDI